MKVTPVPLGFDLSRSAPGYVRSGGLHMSEIYNSLYSEMEPERYKLSEPMDPLRVGLGLAFEEKVEQVLLASNIARPGEFTDDEYGIIYSPDLLFFEDVTRLGELKLTWASCREMPSAPTNHLPPNFSKYLVQMMSYCKCLGTPYARLIAYFVNGDYSKPLRPQLRAWDLEFSTRELHENWQMIINHAKQRKML